MGKTPSTISRITNQFRRLNHQQWFTPFHWVFFEFVNLELDSITLKVTRWPCQEYMVKRIFWGVVSGWWLMFALQNFSLPRSALCGAHGRCDHRGTLAPTATIDGAGVWTWYKKATLMAFYWEKWSWTRGFSWVSHGILILNSNCENHLVQK